MSSLKVYLIPNAKQKEFAKLEEKVQKDLADSSAKYPLGVVEPWLFMSEEMYKVSLNRFKVYKEEYYQMRNKIVSQYEDIKQEFLLSLIKTTSQEGYLGLYSKKLEELILSKGNFEARSPLTTEPFRKKGFVL